MDNGIFYKMIMGDDETTCKNVFHQKWLALLDSTELPYGKAIQLRIGNHLRPLLVYWGRALGCAGCDCLLSDDVLELSVCVELLHKISIIVDDLIDKDNKRHNQTAFHIQFSDEETIIFAVYMMGIAFEKICDLSKNYSYLQPAVNSIYAKTIQTMAKGCLSELSLTSEERFEYESIMTIITQETSILIKNSLKLGFMTNSPTEDKIIDKIEIVGEKVGYLFQAMNDLEPFCAAQNLIQHKGFLNLDFNHSRKSIVLPYIFGNCSLHEKKELVKTDTLNKEIILDLYKKYCIEDVIKNDLNSIENEIEAHFCELENLQINTDALLDFRHFYDDVINIAKSRLQTKFTEPID